MPNLLNTETNKLEDVAPDQMHSLLASGKYDLTRGSQVDLMNPDGTMVTVPSEHAYRAVSQYGYSFPKMSDIQEFDNEKQYGDGIANSAKAFGLGAARSATFGASDYFVNPEVAKQLEQRHPWATGAGEVTGIAGSLLVAPEATPVGLVAKAGATVTERAAPILAKAGAALANPETAPLAAKVIDSIGRVGATTLGSAVEGAAYGLGQSVSEHALGDPDLNADKIMGNIGYGALLGGAIGGALKTGEIAIPASYGAAKDAVGKVYDYAVGTPEKIGPVGESLAKLSSFVSGKPTEEIVQGIKQRSLALTSPEEQMAMAHDFSGGLQEQLTKINKALSDANKDVRMQETAKYLEGFSTEQVLPEFQKTVGSLNEKIRLMREEPDLYPQSYPRILEQIRDRVSKEVIESSSALDIFDSLNGLKKRLDEEIQYGAIPGGGDLRAQRLIGDVRKNIKTTLENENLWGQAAARQAAFNDAQSEFLNLVGKKGLFKKDFMAPVIDESGRQVHQISASKIKTFLGQINDIRGETKVNTLSKFLDSSENLLNELEKTYQSFPEKNFNPEDVRSVLTKNQQVVEQNLEQARFNKSMGIMGAGAHNVQLAEGGAFATAALGHPVLGGALEAWNMLKSPGIAIQRLAKIERLIQKTTNGIEKGASLVFKGVQNAVEPTKGLITQKLLPPMAIRENHDKSVMALNDLNANPEKLIDSLHASTKEIQPYAPQISQSLNMAATRATQFLASKAPMPTMQAPLSPKYVPSDSEIATFQRYNNAVENPVGILKDLKNGTISREAMEAIQTVYPKLYTQMQQSVMDKLTEHLGKKNPEPLPYRLKVSLSMFLGQDLDSSLNQMSIAMNQATLAHIAQKNDAKEAMAQGAVRSTQKGLSNLTASSRIETAMQSNSQRERG